MCGRNIVIQISQNHKTSNSYCQFEEKSGRDVAVPGNKECAKMDQGMKYVFKFELIIMIQFDGTD